MRGVSCSTLRQRDARARNAWPMTEATMTDATQGMKEQAKQGLEWSTGYLLSTLAAVPDDKLGHSPSATAKPALQLAAHIAVTNQAFASMLRGETMPEMTLPELIGHMDNAEKAMATRDEVVSAVKATTADLAAAIDGVKPEDISREIPTPFGTLSVPFLLQLCATHAMCHAAQIDYLQTTWGDMEMHFDH